MQYSRIISARGLAVSGLLAVLVGCGDGRDTRVPVSGTVLIDGKPLTSGSINVVPSNARVAGSKIGPNGRFQLTTYDLHDGCAAGTHAVEITSFDILEKGKVRRWNIPHRYSKAATSQLTLDVTKPTEEAVIELHWNGEKPFVEKQLAPLTYSEGVILPD